MYQLRLRFCKVSGIESATSLKKDFLQASRVFSGEFLKIFVNSFWRISTRSSRSEIFHKKVLSPNSSFLEKEKVLTFTLCTLYLTFLLNRWRRKLSPAYKQPKVTDIRFSNSVIKILDSTLTFFKSSSKDASTSAAVVEYSITPCL